MLRKVISIKESPEAIMDLLVTFFMRFGDTSFGWSSSEFKRGEIVRLMDNQQIELYDGDFQMFNRIFMPKVTKLGHDEQEGGTYDYDDDGYYKPKTIRKIDDIPVEWQNVALKESHLRTYNGYYISEVSTAFSILTDDRNDFHTHFFQEGSLMIVLDSTMHRECAGKFTKTFPTITVGIVNSCGFVQKAKVAVAAISSASVPFIALAADQRI
jgi:hypothetical protein